MRKKQNAFTLVELVVVVLILGILAAVAAPRLFDTANNARESGSKQSLAVVRDAIELYKSQNGSFPPAATLSTALKPYIKGQFPAVQVGANKNANVAVATSPITTPVAGGAGWAYDAASGEIVINDATYIAW
jgi:general secretion pathway protein G